MQLKIYQLDINFRICPLALKEKNPTYYHIQKLNEKLFDDSNSFDVNCSSIKIKPLSDSIEQSFSKLGRPRLAFPTHIWNP